MIRLRNVSELYPLVSNDAPGLNENTALEHLIAAAREFCMETHVSQDDIETSIAAGDETLYVDGPFPAHVFVHRILSVQAAQRAIVIKSVAELNVARPGWRTHTGAPNYCTPMSNTEMRLVPIPTTAEDGIIARVVLAPKPTGTTKLDGAVMDRYAEDIADGALSRILRLNDQPWTNLGEADRRRARFTTAMSRARTHGAANQAVTDNTPRIRRIGA